MRRFAIAIVLSALLLVAITSAQQAPTTSVPNLIRYGGTLKDAQGAPLSSSTLGATFAIYSQQDGGAPIWMETQNVTTDAAGNYSVLLGSTTATGLPGDLFSQQEQRWLGVQIQGQAEQPRVLMVSVPYAFKAHEAETLGGKTVSDFVLATGATPHRIAAAASVPSAPASNKRPSSTAEHQRRGQRWADELQRLDHRPDCGRDAEWIRSGSEGLRAYPRNYRHRDRPQRHGLRCPGCGYRHGRRWPDWHRDFHHWLYLRLARNFEQHCREQGCAASTWPPAAHDRGQRLCGQCGGNCGAGLTTRQAARSSVARTMERRSSPWTAAAT